jgi:hypothetical protein
LSHVEFPRTHRFLFELELEISSALSMSAGEMGVLISETACSPWMISKCFPRRTPLNVTCRPDVARQVTFQHGVQGGILPRRAPKSGAHGALSLARTRSSLRLAR